MSKLFRQVFSDWNTHNAPRLGAAVAFYALLSLSPLVVLVVAIAGVFMDRSVVLKELTWQFQYLIGLPGAQAVNALLASAQTNSDQAKAASIASLVTLFIGASGVLSELRSALNTIWDVDPARESGFRNLLRARLLMMGMVVAIGFLLLASLVLSAVFSATSAYLLGVVSFQGWVGPLTDFGLSLAGVAAVFALIFKYMPDAVVRWRDAWLGGGFTAVLFTLGKYAIATYLTTAAVGSAYGAAGSVVVVILWVYYTAQIFFLGAEFTHSIGVPTKLEV
jgi:membrane protein